MKNTIKVFGIIALVAIIGFSFVACDTGGGGGGGGNPTPTPTPTPGKLTITNFSSELTAGKYVVGNVSVEENTTHYFAAETPTGSSPVSGKGVIVPSSGSIILNVYKADKTPFTGSLTVAIGDLYISVYGSQSITNMNGGQETFFTNTAPITFTNGNATINFGTQMEEDD